MKTQHTPGPWRHVTARLVTDEETQGYHVEDFFRDGKYLGPDCDGIYPAIIDDALANTRLIAAAPELLVELMEQVEVIYSIRCRHQTLAVSANLESDQKFHRDLAERLTAYEVRARAAIAKATA
jgi:hypothetical protein